MTGSSPQRGNAAAMPVASRPLFIFAALLIAMLLLALVVTVAGTVVWIVLSGSERIPDPSRQWPRLTNLAIVAVPIVALLLGAMLARRGGGGTAASASSWPTRRQLN